MEAGRLCVEGEDRAGSGIPKSVSIGRIKENISQHCAIFGDMEL